jgi:hypothetical protein
MRLPTFITVCIGTVKWKCRLIYLSPRLPRFPIVFLRLPGHLPDSVLSMFFSIFLGNFLGLFYKSSRFNPAILCDPFSKRLALCRFLNVLYTLYPLTWLDFNSPLLQTPWMPFAIIIYYWTFPWHIQFWGIRLIYDNYSKSFRCERGKGPSRNGDSYWIRYLMRLRWNRLECTRSLLKIWILCERPKSIIDLSEASAGRSLDFPGFSNAVLWDCSSCLHKDRNGLFRRRSPSACLPCEPFRKGVWLTI